MLGHEPGGLMAVEPALREGVPGSSWRPTTAPGAPRLTLEKTSVKVQTSSGLRGTTAAFIPATRVFR